MAKKKTVVNPFILPAFILGCILVGSSGSIFTMPAIPTWYAGLAKPSFTPPNWLFGPAWTTLFTLMGISAYLVYRRGLGDIRVREAMLVFIIQFILNISWSFLFFGLKSPALGFAGITALWVAIAGTIALFYKINRVSAYLLVPYLLWVTFAAALNAAVYILN